MPAPDLSSFKVAFNETSSASKFDGLVQAIQDEFGDIDADQIPGYPADATKVLLGDGSWGVMPFVLLGDIDLSAVTAFTSIPSGFRALKLHIIGRGTAAVVVDSAKIRLNSDAGANYDNNGVFGNNNAASSAALLAQTAGDLGAIPGANATANRAGVCDVLIPGYTSGFHKMVASHGEGLSTSAAANMWTQVRCTCWLNTAAITRIDLLAGAAFAAGSRAQLYGVL